MKRLANCILMAVLCGGYALAQPAAAHIAESKQNYSGVKNNLQKMAEQMTEENYSFKATPDVRTFGELVAHVADTQARLCSMASGGQKSVGGASKTTKADLVAALKDSSAICDAAFDSLTAETASQPAGMGRSKRSARVQHRTFERRVRIHVRLYAAEGSGPALERRQKAIGRRGLSGGDGRDDRFCRRSSSAILQEPGRPRNRRACATCAAGRSGKVNV